MPCKDCDSEERCHHFGLCQRYRLPYEERAVTTPQEDAALLWLGNVRDEFRRMANEANRLLSEHARNIANKQCRPGSRCERRALGMEPCVAGECRTVDGDGVPAAPNFGYTMNRTTWMVETRTQREDDAIAGVGASERIEQIKGELGELRSAIEAGDGEAVGRIAARALGVAGHSKGIENYLKFKAQEAADGVGGPDGS